MKIELPDNISSFTQQNCMTIIFNKYGQVEINNPVHSLNPCLLKIISAISEIIKEDQEKKEIK